MYFMKSSIVWDMTHVARRKPADVSEEHITGIFRIEEARNFHDAGSKQLA
jgi:uncharacterized protein YehS (DUF1456 family)